MEQGGPNRIRLPRSRAAAHGSLIMPLAKLVHLQQRPIDAHVGQKIRQRRRDLGVTQEKLGNLIGVSFQQVQKYEKGINRVRASRLLQIANVLDVTPSFFFEGAQVEARRTSTDAKRRVQLADIEHSLNSEEGKSLNEAFAKIANPEIRKGIIYLVKKLALEQA
jgi:transcriptional regulator with XRE-family HTH domain